MSKHFTNSRNGFSSQRRRESRASSFYEETLRSLCASARDSFFPILGRSVGLLMLFVLSGCAVFQPRAFLELECAPQASLPAPQSFQAVQSVVFSFYGRTMTGIGVISLNRSDRTFELSCMTPMGTKLFDLRYANETPEVLFALPFFTEKGDFAEAVALDIARMYFDPEPPRISRAWRKGDTLTIESEDEERRIEYDYHGTPPVLMEKRFHRDRALEAVITYSKFFEQDGFRCIGEASLKSKLYGYRLTVRTKELTLHPERIAK